VLAMQLRKNGLIRKAGRGMNAAEMTAKDATSLFISSISGGHAIETARTTANVMSSVLSDNGDVDIRKQNERVFEALTKIGIFNNVPISHNFGQAIEEIFSFFIEPTNVFDFDSDQIWIEVERSYFGFRCEISVDISSISLDDLIDQSMWYSNYDWRTTKVNGYYTYKDVTTSVSGRAILYISRCLRQSMFTPE
jgi:hypothetical protein